MNVNVMNTSNGNSFAFYTKTKPCGDNQKGVIPIVFLRLQVKIDLTLSILINFYIYGVNKSFHSHFGGTLSNSHCVSIHNNMKYGPSLWLMQRIFSSLQTWIPDWRTGGVQKVSLKCSKYQQLWRALWPNHRLSILWILWKWEDLHHRSCSGGWSYWQWLQEASKMCQVRRWRFNLSW